MIYYTKQKSNIYVNDEFGFLFCRVPKVGITNWKRLLVYLLQRDKTNSYVLRIPEMAVHVGRFRQLLESTLLSTYSPSEVQYRLKNYLKIMFVRHPLDRLLSAYRSKFTRPTHDNVKNFYRTYGKYIISRYRQTPSPISLELGADVKFDEFLRFVSETRRGHNAHWAPYVNQCFPCEVGYDFIGRYETMTDDANFLLDLWNVTNIRFPKASRPLSEESYLFQHAYRNISSNLTDELLRQYEADFKAFDFDKAPDFDSSIHPKDLVNGRNISLASL